MRERIADFVEPKIAALGNRQSSRENVGRVLEDLIHLVVALDVELVALKLHPVRILNTLPGLNADHHVLRVGIVFAQVMTVVGGDHRYTEVFFQAE